jgi:hypothetical protein
MNTDLDYLKKREDTVKKNFNAADKNGTGILNQQEFMKFNDKEMKIAEELSNGMVDLGFLRDAKAVKETWKVL